MGIYNLHICKFPYKCSSLYASIQNGTANKWFQHPCREQGPKIASCVTLGVNEEGDWKQ